MRASFSFSREHLDTFVSWCIAVRPRNTLEHILHAKPLVHSRASSWIHSAIGGRLGVFASGMRLLIVWDTFLCALVVFVVNPKCKWHHMCRNTRATAHVPVSFSNLTTPGTLECDQQPKWPNRPIRPQGTLERVDRGLTQQIQPNPRTHRNGHTLTSTHEWTRERTGMNTLAVCHRSRKGGYGWTTNGLTSTSLGCVFDSRGSDWCPSQTPLDSIQVVRSSDLLVIGFLRSIFLVVVMTPKRLLKNPRSRVVQVLYVSWRWNTMLTYGNDTENHRYVFGVIGLALYG